GRRAHRRPGERRATPGGGERLVPVARGLLDARAVVANALQELCRGLRVERIRRDLLQQCLDLADGRVDVGVVQLLGVQLVEALGGTGVLGRRLLARAPGEHQQQHDGEETGRHGQTPRKRRRPKFGASSASKMRRAAPSMSYSTRMYSTVRAVVSQTTKHARLS